MNVQKLGLQRWKQNKTNLSSPSSADKIFPFKYAIKGESLNRKESLNSFTFELSIQWLWDS